MLIVNPKIVTNLLRAADIATLLTTFQILNARMIPLAKLIGVAVLKKLKITDILLPIQKILKDV